MQLTHELRYILAQKKPAFNSKGYIIERKSESQDDKPAEPVKDKWTPEPSHPWILTRDKIERMQKIRQMRNLGMTSEQIDLALKQ